MINLAGNLGDWGFTAWVGSTLSFDKKGCFWRMNATMKVEFLLHTSLPKISLSFDRQAIYHWARGPFINNVTFWGEKVVVKSTKCEKWWGVTEKLQRWPIKARRKGGGIHTPQKREWRVHCKCDWWNSYFPSKKNGFIKHEAGNVGKLVSLPSINQGFSLHKAG